MSEQKRDSSNESLPGIHGVAAPQPIARGHQTCAQSAEPPFPSETDDIIDLPSLFLRMSIHYHDLHVPVDADLAPLIDELGKATLKLRTMRYILITLVTIFFLATAPLVLVFGFRAALAAQPTVASALSQKQYLNHHPEIAVAAGLACFAAVFYAFLWPSLRFQHFRLGKFPKTGSWTPSINRVDWRFVVYVALVNYFAMGVGLSYLSSYTVLSDAVTRGMLTLWIFLPLMPMSLLPTLLLMLIAILISASYDDLFTHAPQGALLLHHLRLLDTLKAVSTPAQLTSDLRRDLTGQIAALGSEFANLYKRGSQQQPSTAWASQRMELVGENVLILASWIAFPKPDTIAHVKSRIVASTNNLAAGTYDMLPSQVVGEDAGLLREVRRTSHLRRIGALAALFALVSGPLVIFVAAVSRMRVNIPSPLQTPAVIAYSAWIVFCLVGYLDRLTPEAKTLMLDVIRLVFRR